MKRLQRLIQQLLFLGSLVVIIRLPLSEAQELVGTPPVCFLMELSPLHNGTLLEDDDNDTADSMYLMHALDRLPECYNGTTLNATLYDSTEYKYDRPSGPDGSNSDPVYRVYTGSSVHLGIKLDVNVSEILAHMDEPALLGDHFRFHSKFALCDALKIGSCTPLLHTVVENATVPLYSTRNDRSDGRSSRRAPNPPMGAMHAPYHGYNPEDENATDGEYNPGDEYNPSEHGNATDQEYHSGHYQNNESSWTERTLLSSLEEQMIFRAAVNVTIQIPDTGRVGAFFVIGECIIDFYQDDGTIQRVTISSAVPEYALFVSQPPLILTGSKATKIYLGVAIGLAGTFALACLVFILYHRAHPVMLLAQGPFLAALSTACFMQTVFSFTYLPTEDVYCNLKGILVYLPIHLGAAIVVARMWRIHTTLAAADLLGRSSETCEQSKDGRQVRYRWTPGADFMRLLTWLARLPFSFCGTDRRRVRVAQNSIRQAATTRETVSLIILLTLPQLVLQVFGVAFYDRKVVTDFDPEGDVGRLMCSPDGKWVLYAGVCFFVAMYLIAVVVAWISQNLPSAFNETSRVFRAAAVVILLVFIAAPLVVAMDSPGNSPDITVFFCSFVSIGIAVTILIVIVLPKIRRVISGEKVVVSTLLDARFSKWSGTHNTGVSTPSTRLSDDDESEVRHVLGKDDPLPRSVEKHVVHLESVLRSITSKCCDGRPLTPQDWNQLRGEATMLQAELGRIDLKWEQDVEQQQKTQ